MVPVVAVGMDDERPSPPWFTINDFAKKLSHPFLSPGGPVAVVGAAASKRQRVSDFHQQATAALAGLAAEVQQGLAEQAAATGTPLSFNSIQAADLSVPLASDPACITPAAASPAGPGAAVWLAPLLPNNLPTIPDAVRNLESWREGAATGVSAAKSGRVQRSATVIAAGTGVTDDMLQPGSDTVITVVIFEAGSEQTKVVLQEIQVLGSNTLADLRDSITCPLDRLAEGLGTSNPASYFFIDDTFHDDTRQASNTECSALLQQWAAAAGILKPRALVHACKEVEEYQEQQWQQQQQDRRGSIMMQQATDQQQELQQQQQLAGVQQQPNQQQHPDMQLHAQQQQQEHPDLQSHPQHHQQQRWQHPDLQPQHQQQQQQQPDLQLHDQQQQQHPDLQPHHQQQHPHVQPQHQQQQQQDTPTGDSPTSMQHTRLFDLHLQVCNRPLCLYSHQGFCEHQMMIADVRLLHKDDPQAKSAYPRTVYEVPVGKRFQCNVCKSRKGASTLLVNHPETPEQVSVLCNSCAGLFDTTAYPNSKRVELE